MKSRLLLLAVLLVIICASCQPKKKTEPEKEAVTGATYTNPLRERGAEPWAVFHEGKYYYTQGAESRIVLWETSDITNLNDSLKKPKAANVIEKSKILKDGYIYYCCKTASINNKIV